MDIWADYNVLKGLLKSKIILNMAKYNLCNYIIKIRHNILLYMYLQK